MRGRRLTVIATFALLVGCLVPKGAQAEPVRLDFEIDGKQVRIERGDFTYLPRKTVHAFKGASPSPARVLIFAAPAHSSAFFEDVNREVRMVPDDLAKVPSIGQRHGIEFIPAHDASAHFPFGVEPAQGPRREGYAEPDGRLRHGSG